MGRTSARRRDLTGAWPRSGPREREPVGLSGTSLGLRRERQVDGEDRAFAQFAVDVERAAVVANDMLDDGEAEPRAAQLARARGVDPVEALGQPRQMIAGDAFAVIADGYGERRRALPRRSPRPGGRRGRRPPRTPRGAPPGCVRRAGRG